MQLGSNASLPILEQVWRQRSTLLGLKCVYRNKVVRAQKTVKFAGGGRHCSIFFQISCELPAAALIINETIHFYSLGGEPKNAWFGFHFTSNQFVGKETVPPARMSHCNTTLYQWHSCTQRRKSHWSQKVNNRNRHSRPRFLVSTAVNITVMENSCVWETSCTDSLVRSNNFVVSWSFH